MESRVLFVVGQRSPEQVADHLAQFQTWNLREIKTHSGFGSAFCGTDTASNFRETKSDSRETKIF
jgi:hypothetical protein